MTSVSILSAISTWSSSSSSNESESGPSDSAALRESAVATREASAGLVTLRSHHVRSRPLRPDSFFLTVLTTPRTRTRASRGPVWWRWVSRSMT